MLNVLTHQLFYYFLLLYNTKNSPLLKNEREKGVSFPFLSIYQNEIKTKTPQFDVGVVMGCEVPSA